MTTARLIPLLLLLATTLSWAAQSDRQQPIEVEADRLEVREQEKVSIYEGNVRLNQGSLRIESDRLVIHFNDINEITLMEMTGRPAKLDQLDDAGNPMHGEAEQIDYSEADTLLILRRSAYLDHAGDVIRGELIRLNTATNAIEAGDPDSNDRVKMVIQPRAPANGDSGASGSND